MYFVPFLKRCDNYFMVQQNQGGKQQEKNL